MYIQCTIVNCTCFFLFWGLEWGEDEKRNKYVYFHFEGTNNVYFHFHFEDRKQTMCTLTARPEPFLLQLERYAGPRRRTTMSWSLFAFIDSIEISIGKCSKIKSYKYCLGFQIISRCWSLKCIIYILIYPPSLQKSGSGHKVIVCSQALGLVEIVAVNGCVDQTIARENQTRQIWRFTVRPKSAPFCS